MLVETHVTIHGSRAAVWAALTDKENAAENFLPPLHARRSWPHAICA